MAVPFSQSRVCMDIGSAENEKVEVDSAAVAPVRYCHSNSSYLYCAFLKTGCRVLAAALKTSRQVRQYVPISIII